MKCWRVCELRSAATRTLELARKEFLMPVGYSIYIEKPSHLHHRVDPRTKLFAPCISFVLALLFNNPAFLGVLLLAVLAIGLCAKLPLKSFRTYLIYAFCVLVLSEV